MADYLRSVISSLPLEDQAELAELMAAAVEPDGPRLEWVTADA